jgi:hypothetical protein
MKHFKVYKNTEEFTIVEAESPIKAQWMAGFMPFRVVECNEDGTTKLPEGHKQVNTNNKNHTK